MLKVVNERGHMTTTGTLYRETSDKKLLNKMRLNRMDLDVSHRLTFGDSREYRGLDGVMVDIKLPDGKALAIDENSANLGTLNKEALAELGGFAGGDYDILFTSDNPVDSNFGSEQTKYKHVILPRLGTDCRGCYDKVKSRIWGLASSKKSSFLLRYELYDENNVMGIRYDVEIADRDWIYFGNIGNDISDDVPVSRVKKPRYSEKHQLLMKDIVEENPLATKEELEEMFKKARVPIHKK